eukprot:Gb_19128 [translate_table: standard]
MHDKGYLDKRMRLEIAGSWYPSVWLKITIFCGIFGYVSTVDLKFFIWHYGIPSERPLDLFHIAILEASMLDMADGASMDIVGNNQQIENLQACIKYEQGDIAGCRMIWEENADGNMDAVINIGCCFYKGSVVLSPSLAMSSFAPICLGISSWVVAAF